ncbi:MAG TPA: ABC transporter permease [Terracidiphilus sp.]|jgi:predicted permease|nr:ABC transporter permease [Terracidiphilus sp.]
MGLLKSFAAGLEILMQDLRYSLRMLARSPGFTLVAVLTLALGIGANSAMFSVVEGVVLAPLPFPQPDRLVFLWESRPGVPQLDVSYPNFQDWQRSSRSFEQMSALTFHNFDLTGTGNAEHLVGMRVSSTFLATLGVRPAVGRDFTPAEDESNAAPVALLSDRLWRERYGADARVPGRTAVLDGKSYTVIGVLPPHFHFVADADVVTLLRPNMPVIYAERSVDALAVVARLKSGVEMRQAERELNAVQQDLVRRYPDANRTVRAAIVPLKQQIIGDVKGTVLLLFGAVSLVLLIACANLANLLLARSTARVREFGIRAALGASRARMVRQLLTESIMLSVAGGGLGLAVAALGLRVFLAALPDTLPRAENIGLSMPVLLFTIVASMVVGVVFGIGPALRCARADVQEALQEASRGATSGRHRVLSNLVVVQFALTLVLLVGAGLLLRSIRQLWHVNPGFDTQHVISFKVGLSPSLTQTPAGTRIAYQQLLERIRRIPGIEAADLTNIVPLTGGDNGGPFWIGTAPPASMQEAPHALYFWTGPDYLETMRIPLLQGRFFTAADQIGSAKVVVIDSVLAQTFFPGQNPVGQTITVGHWGAARIVGVVGHVRNWGLDDPGTYNPRQIYIPAYQLPDSMVTDFFRNLTLLARTSIAPADLMPAIRDAVYASAPDQPVYAIRTIEEVESESMASRRLPVLLLGAFAALALLLASVGIYGVVSYSVVQRVREIGIRMALGADRRQVFRMIVGQGLRMAAAGLAIGAVAALALTRVLPSFSHLLYGVGKGDPLTFFAVSAGLMIVAVAACYLPARRAMRADPMASLRCE